MFDLDSVPMDRTKKEHIGLLEKVVWCDDDKPVSILKLTDGKSVVIDAASTEFVRGQKYRFLGYWQEGKHGPQFKASTFVRDTPASRAALVKYLSDTCEGIGPKIANRLWELYGPDAVKLLREEPQRVADDKVMSLEAAQEAASKLAEFANDEQTRIDLFGLFAGRGFPGRLIDRAIDANVHLESWDTVVQPSTEGVEEEDEIEPLTEEQEQAISRLGEPIKTVVTMLIVHNLSPEQVAIQLDKSVKDNLLLLLVVHTGRMELSVSGANDAAHYTPALRQFRQRHRQLRGVFLIHDGGPGHIAAAATDYLAGCDGWWRPRLTPAHASWLNQAEMRINAFGGRYLKRGSWSGRDEFIDHVSASCPEYNRLYAHPFEWTWTNNQMRNWFAKHAQPICCTTS